MASVWDSPLFQPPLVYLLVAGVAIVVMVLIFYKFRKKGELEHYKGETLEMIFKKKNFDKYMNNFGRKCKKGQLIWNMGKVNISKIVMLKTKLEKVNKVDTKIDRQHSFIIMQKKKFFLFALFGDKEYFVFENENNHIQKDLYNDRWVANPSVNMYLYGGIWVSSLGTQSYLTELLFKNTYENDKEVETNTPKRFVWYNDIYAQKFTNETIKAELEKDKYDSAVARETGTNKRNR